MSTLLTIAWVIAAVFSWILTGFCTFKARQSSGKSFVNDVYTDLGEGSFFDSIIHPIKKFMWEIFSLCCGLLALGLSFGLLGKMISDENNVTKPEKTISQPMQSVPAEQPKIEQQQIIINTTDTNTQNQETVGFKDQSNNTQIQISSESVIAQCESESNLFSVNNCRWKVCAELQNKNRDECRNYTKD